MSRRQAGIYRGVLRSGKITDHDLKPKKLTPEQILSLRYQCAIESKDFETAKALKALMDSSDEKNNVSDARQKAEQLFRRINGLMERLEPLTKEEVKPEEEAS